MTVTIVNNHSSQIGLSSSETKAKYQNSLLDAPPVHVTSRAQCACQRILSGSTAVVNVHVGPRRTRGHSYHIQNKSVNDDCTLAKRTVHNFVYTVKLYEIFLEKNWLKLTSNWWRTWWQRCSRQRQCVAAVTVAISTRLVLLAEYAAKSAKLALFLRRLWV